MRRTVTSSRSARLLALVGVLVTLVAAGGAAAAVADPDASVVAPATTLDRAESATQVSGGTWSELFDPGSLANRAPVVFWAAALVLLGVIALPYVWLAAARLPDRGYALTRPIGLLLVAWIVWLLASTGVATFSQTTIWIAIGVVGAGALGIAMAHRRELGAWLVETRRLLLVEEAVFWVLFGTATFVRWSNPDLWHPTLGGEKPMDFAFLNAVVKSTEFPPYDPWFAGGAMNYYYFGFVLVAVLVKLTAIVPAVAYNLAIPTFLAFLGAGACGVAVALVSGGERTRKPVAGRGVLLAGVLAALLVAVVGNLGELRVLADRVSGAVPLDWWYWNPSRVIGHPDTEPGPITEFPAFTYLYADLHAHAMALPFTVVTLGLALAFVGASDRARGGALVRIVLLGLAVGALWPLNTWDFPTYAFLVLAVFLVAAARGPRPWRETLRAVARWVVVVGLGYLAFLPFHDRYVSGFDGFARWHGSRTDILDYLTIHGLFLFVIVAALLVDFLRANDLNAVARRLRLYVRRWNEIRRLRTLEAGLVRPTWGHHLGIAAALAGFVPALVVAVLGLGVPAVVVGVSTLICLLVVRRRGGARAPDRRSVLWSITLVLALVGLLLTLAVEFIVVKNIDIGRVNTVFKTYLQVWVLLALASAACFYSLYERLPRLSRAWTLAWRLGFVSLLAIALLYPILATRAKVADRFDTSVGRTLDGTAFMTKAVLADQGTEIPLAPDRGAIDWMLTTLKGSPVIAEVNTAPTLYGWGNRYAMFTGNPAVVGWDFHERQQRGDDGGLVTNRVADVQQAYATADPGEAYEILERYGVRYVVVGPLERAYFPDGDAKWDEGRGRYWEFVYDRDGVSILELRSEEDPGAEASR